MTAKAEATGSTIKINYAEEVYEIPPANEWDLDVLEAYEDGKIVTVVRALLGPEGWQRFRSVPRTVGDLRDLMTAIEVGLGSPN